MMTSEIIEKIKNWYGREVDTRSAFNSNTPSLRFGYWARVDVDGLDDILKPYGLYAVEIDDYDDDCGWLYWYHIKNLK